MSQITVRPEVPMPNRFLHYGGSKYILNREGEARLQRVLESVYGSGVNHHWFTLYPESPTPCSLLIAPGVPMSVETEYEIGDDAAVRR
ncbi:hypothetical protein GCM10010528_08140 [Gordonia defluvii]|uniref:Uncharacterized protein n=1 Tax=Gordonia defluvii TaxID=283718 RepID=A0ABP6L4Q2_9ACTN